MNAEFSHLKAFVAVVDEGSFTDAAASLDVSQAAVSRGVAALERVIGAKVLRRTTREVGLTPAGARLIGPARRVLADMALIAGIAGHVSSELRVGYAWAALGRHTTGVQQRWADEFPGSELVFVQSMTATAGLAEGSVDVAVLRRPVSDERMASALVGVEQRFAALATSDPLARRRSLTLNDFSGRVVGIDDRTGTTTPDLWPTHAAPSGTRMVRGVEDWLTLIAAGQAIGMTSEATIHQHPRPGVKFRPVRDAQPIPLWLAWRRHDPPERVETLVQLVCEAYGAHPGASGR